MILRFSPPPLCLFVSVQPTQEEQSSPAAACRNPLTCDPSAISSAYINLVQPPLPASLSVLLQW